MGLAPNISIRTPRTALLCLLLILLSLLLLRLRLLLLLLLHLLHYSFILLLCSGDDHLFHDEDDDDEEQQLRDLELTVLDFCPGWGEIVDVVAAQLPAVLSGLVDPSTAGQRRNR